MSEKYICSRKCFHNGRLYLEGEPVDFGEGVKVPKHFKPLDPKEVKPQEPVKEDAEEPEKERLRGKLESMGKSYDRRWGIDKLEIEIQKAEKGM